LRELFSLLDKENKDVDWVSVSKREYLARREGPGLSLAVNAGS